MEAWPPFLRAGQLLEGISVILQNSPWEHLGLLGLSYFPISIFPTVTPLSTSISGCLLKN